MQWCLYVYSAANCHTLCSKPLYTLQWTTVNYLCNRKSPTNIWYGRMAERIIGIEISIHRSLKQLPNTSITACFNLGTNGKRLFDDSHVIWFQTLGATFSGALAWFLVPFIKHAFFLPSYNRSHLNQRFTIHNLKPLHATPVVPMHCQLRSLGSVFIFLHLR